MSFVNFGLEKIIGTEMPTRSYELTGGGIKLTKCGGCSVRYHPRQGHDCPTPAVPKE